MNYLAHAYLSFGIPDIVVGNLISDFIKGKRKLEYPERIQAGIALHRAIDGFTDTHPVTREAKSCFRTDYGLYSGAITDVVYDHFLANDPLIFPSPGALAAFSRATYGQLEGRADRFPERFARIFPYMRDQDWLYHYRFRQGVFNSLHGLARRAAYMPGAARACELFEIHYNRLEINYREFFPELKDFASRTLDELGGGEKGS